MKSVLRCFRVLFPSSVFPVNVGYTLKSLIFSVLKIFRNIWLLIQTLKLAKTKKECSDYSFCWHPGREGIQSRTGWTSHSSQGVATYSQLSNREKHAASSVLLLPEHYLFPIHQNCGDVRSYRAGELLDNGSCVAHYQPGLATLNKSYLKVKGREKIFLCEKNWCGYSTFG